LQGFRDKLQTWQLATVLPVDQLILTISQEIHHKPYELALDYKLALLLKSAQELHPDWRLPQLSDELKRIESNEFSLRGFSVDDMGFDPDAHKGRVVVSTMHKAKGLEWDCVYLTSVNNYDFPALGPSDEYQSEKYWLAGQRNLEAEVLEQLEGVVENNPEKWGQEPEEIKTAARVGFAAERLRLLYVGITRAKRSLTITWNTGKLGRSHESAAATALRTTWEGSNREDAGEL
jgi:DNA helicase-2/ATP-dependent DNA helicase PcrA